MAQDIDRLCIAMLARDVINGGVQAAGRGNR